GSGGRDRRPSSSCSRGIHASRHRGVQARGDCGTDGRNRRDLQGPAAQGQETVEGGAWAMNCTEIRERLDDAVDGELSAEGLIQVNSRLEWCDSCRSEKEALDALLGMAAALPKSIEPRRDLWKGIESGLSRRQATRTWRRTFAIAAAVTLLAGV